jgi:hypothetical protein
MYTKLYSIWYNKGKITGGENGKDWWGFNEDWWGISPPVNMLKMP